MRARQRAPLIAAWACLGVFAPHRTLGADFGCTALAVEADASFRARFPELLGRVRAGLAARGDIDACARVELRSEETAAIVVVVALPDGRTASRTVLRPDDVIPTLEALLLVPDRAPALDTTSAALLPRAPAPYGVAADEGNGAAASRSPGSPRALGIELSIMTGARVGDGQVGYGVGVHSFVEASGWLVGFEGHADGYQPLLGGDAQTTLELALQAGRRIHFERVALDLITGPALAMSGISFGQSEIVRVEKNDGGVTPPPTVSDSTTAESQPTTGAVPRWRFGVRLGFSPRSVLRPFVGIDGDVALTRHGDSDRSLDAQPPHLPNYSVGIGVGATVGTP